jgi:hypothetical protein
MNTVKISFCDYLPFSLPLPSHKHVIPEKILQYESLRKDYKLQGHKILPAVDGPLRI